MQYLNRAVELLAKCGCAEDKNATFDWPGDSIYGLPEEPTSEQVSPYFLEVQLQRDEQKWVPNQIPRLPRKSVQTSSNKHCQNIQLHHSLQSAGSAHLRREVLGVLPGNPA